MSTFGTSLRASAFTILICIASSTYAQKIEQPNQAPDYKPIKEAKNNWTSLLGHCGIEETDFKRVCPNLPSWLSIADESALVYAIQTWEQQHPEEVKKFWAVLADMECNVGSTSLYLTPPAKVAQHPWLEWVLSSGLTQDNIYQIAPNAPFFEEKDYDAMEFAIRRWQVLFGHEHEALINHEAMIVINPYYSEYLDVHQIPAFLQALPNSTKPSIHQPATNETELAEEVALQSWYFIFEPQTFQTIYGFYPELPKDFDEEVFREFAKRTAAMSSKEISK
ncbi:MAG: hypothetical protein CMN34_05490 [Saprospirales bacterium]|nr:hypothetical protein [Saprospirales bacterium]|tara:strand:+ start:415 stop:1251 length:837 start_codon:yes stop_codon:yes gene_type:complete